MNPPAPAALAFLKSSLGPRMNLARPVAAAKHAMDAVGAGRCPAAPIDNRCAGYQPAPHCKARETIVKIVAGREEFEA